MVIYDTETSGLIQNMAIPLKQQPKIIELYALKIDDKTLEDVAEWHSLFYIKELSQEVVDITGITIDMLTNAPAFAERVDDLSDFFLGERLMAGHNLSYDRDMLFLELKRLDRVMRFPWPQRHICTVESTESMLGFRLSLTALHEQLFGTGFGTAHRAEADVQATARCLRELVSRGVIEL
jgi:DNA polymerase-3 subunit alpha